MSRFEINFLLTVDGHLIHITDIAMIKVKYDAENIVKKELQQSNLINVTTKWGQILEIDLSGSMPYNGYDETVLPSVFNEKLAMLLHHWGRSILDLNKE